jgi:hypothetical protein
MRALKVRSHEATFTLETCVAQGLNGSMCGPRCISPRPNLRSI